MGVADCIGEACWFEFWLRSNKCMPIHGGTVAHGAAVEACPYMEGQWHMERQWRHAHIWRSSGGVPSWRSSGGVPSWSGSGGVCLKGQKVTCASTHAQFGWLLVA